MTCQHDPKQLAFTIREELSSSSPSSSSSSSSPSSCSSNSSSNGDPTDVVADVAVADMSTFAGDPRLEVIELEPEAIHFVCRREHPLAGQRGVELSRLCEFPLAGCLVPPRLATLFARFPRAGSIDPATGNFHPSIEVKSVEAAIRIAALTDVIAAAQLNSVESQLESGSLVVLDVQGPPLQLRVGLIYLRERSLAPMAQLFLDKLVEVRKHLAVTDVRLYKKFGIRRTAPRRA